MDNSCVHKLPVEVLAEIFAIACSLSSEDGRSLTIKDGFPGTANVFPIILSHVCSRWRDIVPGCPKLWASISVALRDDYYSRRAHQLIEIFLAKSGSCSLDLKADVGGLVKAASRDTWEALTRHISRSHRLHLNLGYCFNDPLAAFQYPRGQDITFNNLFSFHGDISVENLQYDAQYVVNNPFWKALHQAPKLKEVRLHHFHPPNSLPYHQLTTLHIEVIYSGDIPSLLQVLGLSENLRSLTINTYYNHPLNIAPHRVELPSLRDLVINCDSRVNHPKITDPILEVLFSSLVMSTLSSFKLCCTGLPSQLTHWPSSLLTMLQYASTTLGDVSLSLKRSVEGRNSNYPWQPLSLLLNKTPNLTHFEILDEELSVHGENSPSELLISELTYAPGNNAVLPKLEVVSLHGPQLSSQVMSKLLGLATSRSPSRVSAIKDVCPLAKILVVPCIPSDSPAFVLEPHMLKAVEQLEGEEGVKLVIEEAK
ncbi:hypothetical protein L218DRAFT_985255 [Marasmius fiardii PR-910]|nr:hypothetical protein L218DRAFT_985255 [Marasmius fiardii PR-910]